MICRHRTARVHQCLSEKFTARNAQCQVRIRASVTAMEYVAMSAVAGAVEREREGAENHTRHLTRSEMPRGRALTIVGIRLRVGETSRIRVLVLRPQHHSTSISYSIGSAAAGPSVSSRLERHFYLRMCRTRPDILVPQVYRSLTGREENIATMRKADLQYSGLNSLRDTIWCKSLSHSTAPPLGRVITLVVR